MAKDTETLVTERLAAIDQRLESVEEKLDRLLSILSAQQQPPAAPPGSFTARLNKVKAEVASFQRRPA